MVQWTVSFSSRINIFLLIFFHRAIVQPKLGGRPKKTRNKIRRQQKNLQEIKHTPLNINKTKREKKGRKNKERKKKGKFSLSDWTDTDRQRGRAKLLVPFQQPNKKHRPKKKKKKKGQLTHRWSTLTVNLGFLIALDYARLLMCEKRPMWHHQIFPRLSNIPFSFPMITHAYIGLVYFSFFLFSISFFVEWAFNGAIEL